MAKVHHALVPEGHLVFSIEHPIYRHRGIQGGWWMQTATRHGLSIAIVWKVRERRIGLLGAS